MLEKKILELLQDADPKVRSVVLQVLSAEQAKLYQQKPRVSEEIRQIIEAEVRKP